MTTLIITRLKYILEYSDKCWYCRRTCFVIHLNICGYNISCHFLFGETGTRCCFRKILTIEFYKLSSLEEPIKQFFVSITNSTKNPMFILNQNTENSHMFDAVKGSSSGNTDQIILDKSQSDFVRTVNMLCIV